MSGTGKAHGIRLRHVMGDCRRRAVCCGGFIRDVAERMYCNAGKSSVNHVVDGVVPQITRAIPY